MLLATTGPSYLADVPHLPDELLARDHEALPHDQRLREQLLMAELLHRIRLARAVHEAHRGGPIDVEEGTPADYKRSSR